MLDDGALVRLGMGHVDIVGLRACGGRAGAERLPYVALAAPDQLVIVAHAHNLGGPLQGIGEVVDDRGRELDRPGLALDVRGGRVTDQPFVATVDPDVETLLAHQVEGAPGRLGGDSALAADREVRRDIHPAIEAGDGGIEGERLDQHGHATRRTSARDRILLKKHAVAIGSYA